MKSVQERENDIYLYNICCHIHYKKLRYRIRQEISDHLNDMYADMRPDFEDDTSAWRAVRKEMGDPDELGKALRKANRKTLIPYLFLKAAIILTLIFTVPIGVAAVWDQVSEYNSAVDIKTREQQLMEEFTEGEPIKLVAEYEADGYLHRIYMPAEKPENETRYLETKSIKVFGISIYDKFGAFGSSWDSSVSNYNLFHPAMGRNSNYAFGDCIIIYIGDPGFSYVKRLYTPIDPQSGLEEYWSDFIAVPKGATYENPITILETSPDGYTWSVFETYDENKEEYQNPKNDDAISDIGTVSSSTAIF